ncbi:hypothetical protein, partial [Streptococcus pneumoniae]|uniref:hypothetical protein n=1 Tax=Streptococcus pneumoniae TaxID=1313 RepID=UPI001E341FF2
SVGCAQVAKQCPDGSVVGYDPSKPGCVYRPCPDMKNEGGNGKGFDLDLSSLSLSSPLVWVAAAGAALLVFGGGGRR